MSWAALTEVNKSICLEFSGCIRPSKYSLYQSTGVLQPRHKKENTILQFPHTVFLKVSRITIQSIRELFCIACCKLLPRPWLNILGSVKLQILLVQQRDLWKTSLSFSLTWDLIWVMSAWMHGRLVHCKILGYRKGVLQLKEAIQA